MKLKFDGQTPSYKSASQVARYWTEQWVQEHIYCANCGRTSIVKYENNRPVADFYCRDCDEEYELKSKKGRFGAKIVDGAYRTMCERLSSSNNPNFMLLNYDLSMSAVTNFLIIPKHFFVPDIIQKRKPLASTARRAGWVGCNILIDRIPEIGKVFLVQNGVPISKKAVLERWQKTAFLQEKKLDARGWLIEIMKCIEMLRKPVFALDDLYQFETNLSLVFPNNRHVKEKIRQQLQILRDRGYVEFTARGQYRLCPR